MPNKKFKDILNEIPLEIFLNYYKDNNQEDTMNHFDLSYYNFNNYLRYYNIHKSKEDTFKTKSKTDKQKRNIKLKYLSSKIPLNELHQFYTIENHTVEECLQHFNISNALFFQLLKYYNYHKPQDKHVELSKKSKLEKYGSEGYNNREKAKQTCLELYGVENVSQIPGAMEKAGNSKIQKYGSKNNWNKIKETIIKHYNSLDNFYKNMLDLREKTCLDKYGVSTAIQIPEIKEKARENFKNNFLDKYGVENYFQMPNAKRSNGSINSTINIKFKNYLNLNNIEFREEYWLNRKYFDIKINNYLLELNPGATHNINWSPYNAEKGLDKDYHINKSKLAYNNNFQCICIWDWDDWDKIIKLITPESKVENFIIKEVEIEEAKEFLNNNHIFGYIEDNIRLGIYVNDNLTSILTLEKIEENKYNILRIYNETYLSDLINYFISNYNPSSIYYICNLDKYIPDNFIKLGFKLIDKDYNIYNVHISTNRDVEIYGAGLEYYEWCKNSQIL